MLNVTNILVVIPAQDIPRYEENLVHRDDTHIQLVSSIEDALDTLANQASYVDVFVVDNRLNNADGLIDQLRHTYPRLLIILVDEEADFAIPGQADDISTTPFHNDDLMKRITKLMSDRRVETLRSDSLPAVRIFAKHLREASGMIGKQQAAVEACLQTGYDYVAYYGMENGDSTKITLKAQDGPAPIKAVAPKRTTADDLMTWVAQSGQSRIAGPADTPNHPLVAKGRLGAIACVPVTFNNEIFGVLVACRDRPDSITQENILMLELISTQLASAILKERKR